MGERDDHHAPKPTAASKGAAEDAPAPRTMEALLAIAPLAWLSVAIESRVSPALLRRVTPQDLAQDVMLAFWETRDRFEWQGPKALRSYLLTLADRMIAGAADHYGAQKRGGGVAPVVLASSVPGDATTPSVAARRDERAEIMREALNALPSELRECVRLRFFDQAPIKRIAAALDLPESTVRRRLRMGSELYLARLRSAMASHAATRVGVQAVGPAAISAVNASDSPPSG